jgi:hypothetical protein
MILGERFRAGWLKRWILGSDYRDLWTTPIEVPVLDLNRVAGGLTPQRTGGFGQSIALHFAGADGRSYKVRSLDKDPTRRIWDELKDTVVDDILQDQIKALLPAGGLVCDRLMEAAGILYAPQSLVVIPDDPTLAAFRPEFAGLAGMLQEDPSEGPDNTPGFAGSRQICGSDRLWERLEKGPRDRVDARAFLRARLMDLLLNDKDRHRGQWRWARFPDGEDYTWLPIPEDRDQAFIDLDGFAMAVARNGIPSQIEFESEYPNLIGLTMTAWELDRELLVGLDKPAWDSTVTAFQRTLPDWIIEDAVRRLPPPYYERVGFRLAHSLKSRRDRLPEYADRYYRLITRQAEITATDADEYAELEHEPNGDVAVRIGLRSNPEGKEPPYFQRTFHASETDEVRLYLRGGRDQADVLGAGAEITLRIDGGGGDDAFVNSSGAGARRTRFYDHRGKNRFDRGLGATVDERPFERPPGAASTNRQHALDWGAKVATFPIVEASPDLGAYVGMTMVRRHYGWRKVPFASRHRIHLALASNGPEPFASYTGTFRHVLPRVDGRLLFEYSGIRVIRFHGFGNTTTLSGASDFYKVQQQTLVFSPALELEAGVNRARAPKLGAETPRPTFSASLGPLVKYSDTPADQDEDRFIGSYAAPLYGTGSFGQIGAQGGLGYDTRDNPGHAKRGLLLAAAGAFYPAAWDVGAAFGEVHGAVSVYWTAPLPAAPALALRAGGRKVWGDYPFHEAAFLGGHGDLRGYHENRFAGDASAFGNAELRFRLFDVDVLVPGEIGLFAAADAGRVFLGDDPATIDDWHTGVGGGVWLSLLDRTQTLSLAIVDGDDLRGVYLRAGFMY